MRHESLPRPQIKYTFLAAIGIFELGSVTIRPVSDHGLTFLDFSSLVCATAPSSKALIVGRAIAGLGTGGLFSGAIVILAYCCKDPYLFETRLLCNPFKSLRLLC
jgi:MFS family permease